MAIANFETGNGAVSTGGSTKGGSQKILLVVAVLGLAYLGYKYWYLPKQEKEKNDNQR